MFKLLNGLTIPNRRYYCLTFEQSQQRSSLGQDQIQQMFTDH